MNCFLRLGVFTLLASVSGGCLVGRAWVVDHKFDTSALRNAAGEGTLATSRDGDEVDLIAADDSAEFAFRVEPGLIRVSIENLGTDVLILEMDDASYIDAAGQTHRLAVLGRELAQGRGFELQPGSKSDLSLWPSDWTHDGSDGRPSVWRSDSPLGGSTLEESSSEKALAERKQDIGKSFEVVLPIRVADERVSYRFRFAVSELVARKIWWA